MARRAFFGFLFGLTIGALVLWGVSVRMGLGAVLFVLAGGIGLAGTFAAVGQKAPDANPSGNGSAGGDIEVDDGGVDD